MIRARHGDPWQIDFGVGPTFETLSPMIRARHGDPWQIDFGVGPMFETLSDAGRSPGPGGFLQTHGRSTSVVEANGNEIRDTAPK